MALGVTLQPSLVLSLVDSFFELKKVEVKQQVQNSINIAIENVFQQLVIQVKQMLVPDYQPPPESVIQCSKDLLANPSNQQQQNEHLKPIRKLFKSTTPQVDKTEKQPKQVMIQTKTGTIEMDINYQKPLSEHETNIGGDYESSGDITEYEIETDSNGRCENQSTSSRCNKRRSGRVRSKTYTCTFADCSKVFTGLHDLKRHQRFHVGAKPYLCKWSDCSFASVTSANTIRHIKNHLKQLPSSEEEIDPKTYMEIDKELLNQDWATSLDELG